MPLWRQQKLSCVIYSTGNSSQVLLCSTFLGDATIVSQLFSQKFLHNGKSRASRMSSLNCDIPQFFFYLTEKQKNICRLINIFSQFFKESRSHGNWIGIVSKQLQDTLLKKRGTFEKLCVEIPIRPGHHFPRICRVVASGLWFSSMFCYWSLLFTKPGVNRTAFLVGDITNQSSGNLCNIFKNLNFQVPRLYNSLDSDDRDEWESSPTGFRHGSYLVPLLPRQQSLKIRHSCYDRSRWLRFNPPQTCTCCKVRSHQVSAYLPSEWPARVQNRDVF